jgi:hypothetical protein
MLQSRIQGMPKAPESGSKQGPLWGHYINDLVVEWVQQPEAGYFVLFIGC